MNILASDDPIRDIDALLASEHPALRDVLLKATEHDNPTVRMYAALNRAQHFQDVAAVPGLCEVLADRNLNIQRTAMDALWEIGDADPVGLLSVLKAAPTEVRDAAAEALHRIGWVPDQPEIEADFYVATRQWRECITLGEVAVSRLLDALVDWDGAVRRGAAWALGEIGDPAAVPALIGRFNDFEGGMFGVGNRVCDVAAAALMKIGTDEAWLAVDQWQANPMGGGEE